VSRTSREHPRDARGHDTPAGVPARRAVTRGRRPAGAAPLPARHVDDRASASSAEIADLRARLLRFALTLPGVALGDSRLDDDAAGLFVRVWQDDGLRSELREFATLRTHPRWRLSVLVSVDTTARLQRLGWGRPRLPDGPGPLLLDVSRPRSEADIEPLQRVLASAYRAAAPDQDRNR
jgi:hypothetical protein